MRSALLLLLLPSLALAQAVYSWVDKDGEEHFTDDPSTIPARARKRTTSGEPISTVGQERPDAGFDGQPRRRPPPVEADAPSYSEVRWRQLFRAALDKIEALEQQVESDRHLAEDNVIPMQLVCRGPVGTGCMYLPAPELEAAKARHQTNGRALVRARSDLEDLERRASLAGVPREWRR